MQSQAVHLRNSLGISYDQAARELDFNKQVPLASQDTTWTINLMDNSKLTI